MRLCTTSLAGLPDGVKTPGYDRSRLNCGIVHLGLGAFHRAHQAVYTNAALNASATDWMILGASLQTPGASHALNPQDGLFSVLCADDQEESLEVIGAVKEVLFAPAAPARLVAAIASPVTRIVSLTITEKGYCRNPATGALNLADPQIQGDINRPDQPTTALGYLVRGLQARRRNGGPGLTILSCDNIPANGKATRQVLLELAQQIDATLADWIELQVSFPSSMVDRIVPATTDPVRERVAALLGVVDEAAVATEPFSQWVIEDNFSQGRPPWEIAGALFTDSAAPFETMKLRLLNGAHSAMAYLGHLAGHSYVADCMADRDMQQFIRDLMNLEITPTLEPPPDFSLANYIDALLLRFGNSRIKHRCLQIAMDGSQKIPQRLLQTITHRLQTNQDCSHLTLAIAAWMIFATGRDLSGNIHEVQDPLAATLHSLTAPCIGRPAELVGALLQLESVFTPELRHSKALQQALLEQVTLLYRQGVHGALNGLKD